jgi:hypothetical protein
MKTAENVFVIDNKVAKSGLVTIDLEKLAGNVTYKELDLRGFLFKELMLRENDFRNHLENHDWTQYINTVLSVYCSSEAIIPSWAYMLVTIYAREHTKAVFIELPQATPESYFRKVLADHDWSQYESKRVLLKGCSDNEIPQSAYAYATHYLMGYADRIMYGEACSFVPVWRRPKSARGIETID